MSTTEITPSNTLDRRPQAPEGTASPKTTAAPKAQGRKRTRVTLMIVLLLAAAGAAAGASWWVEHLNALPPYIAMANGRLEAEQVEIATKFAGRIAVVLAKEGDMVHAGDVLARMDIKELQAQLAAAEAQVRKAEHEKVMAEAQIAQRNGERVFAMQEIQRTATLIEKGWSTRELLDQRQKDLRVAQAGYDTAVASLDAAKAQITAGEAEVARLQSQINDSTLVAPAGGRIQYKLAQPGEVLAAGGRVLTLLDLGDVYMTIFLSARVAGPLAIGDEARVTLDPLPGYVFPAKVTFVATEAQFTPKTVETPEEREKLMFRVKLSIDPELRERYEAQAKTGIRGIGFVRTERASWPDSLAVRLP
jgi:HlyD family secretion protein